MRSQLELWWKGKEARRGAKSWEKGRVGYQKFWGGARVTMLLMGRVVPCAISNRGRDQKGERWSDGAAGWPRCVARSSMEEMRSRGGGDSDADAIDAKRARKMGMEERLRRSTPNSLPDVGGDALGWEGFAGKGCMQIAPTSHQPGIATSTLLARYTWAGLG